jgi:hypothetical protein
MTDEALIARLEKRAAGIERLVAHAAEEADGWFCTTPLEVIEDWRREGADIRSALAALARVGWRPIESAPDTGSFLVWCQERRNIYVVSRNRFVGQPDHPASEFLHFGTGLYGLTEDPTAWQPPPEPPDE